MIDMVHVFAYLAMNIFITNSLPTSTTDIPVLKWPTAFYTKYIMRIADSEGDIKTKAWVDVENGRQVVSYEDEINVKMYIDGVRFDVFFGSSDDVIDKRLCVYKVEPNIYIVLPPEFMFQYSHSEMKDGIRYDTWKTRPILSKLNLNMVLVTIDRSGISVPHTLNINGLIGILGGSTFNEFTFVYQEFEIRDSVSKTFVFNHISNVECIPETNFVIDLDIYEIIDSDKISTQPNHNTISQDSSVNKFHRMLSPVENVESEKDIIKTFRRRITEKSIFDKLLKIIKDLKDSIQRVNTFTSGESTDEENVIENFRRIFEKERPAAVMKDINDWRGNGIQSLKAINLRKSQFPYVFKWGDDTLPDIYSEKIDAYNNGSYEIPKRFDWREKVQHVPEVRSQYHCGSCWAFMIATTLEWHASIYNRVSLSLSADYMTACSWKYNNGCYGGSFFDAYFWLSLNGGPVTSQSYGANKFYPDRCHRHKENLDFPLPIKKMLIGYKETTVERVKFLLSAFGPIAVSINAEQSTFMNYKEGIYSDFACKSTEASLNHGLVLIGYDTDENGNEYWILQNSWSKMWGENGYIKISTHKNICGILHHGGVPVL